MTICDEHNLPGFETEAELKAYFAELPAITVKRTGRCRYCSLWHAETVMDRISHASGRIPQHAQETGVRLSARSAERFAKL